jgi:hypothetical protein
MDCAPEGYSDHDMQVLDRLIERWLKDCERASKKRKKPGQSPHS